MPARRTPAQWQRLMDQYEQSGQSQEHFCRVRGIALATFAAWRRKLKATSLATAAPAFVEVCLPRIVQLADEATEVARHTLKLK